MDWKTLFARASALALLAAQPAAAQNTTAQSTTLERFDAERLQFNAGAEDSLVVGTGRTPGLGVLRLGTFLHYQHNPLVVMVDGEDGKPYEVGALVAHRYTLNLMGAYAPVENLELNFQLPVIAAQSGDDLSTRGLGRVRPVGLGTPRVGAELRLLQAQVGSVGLSAAAGLQLALPFGTRSAWAGDETRSLGVLPRASASADFGPVTAGLELGATLRSTHTLLQQELGSQLDVGAALVTDRDLLGGTRLELALLSGVPMGPPQESTGVGTELLAGARVPVGPGLELTALGGPGLTRAPGTPAYRVAIGLAYATPEQTRPTDPCASAAHTPAQCPDLDDDGDSIRNAQDACPLQPEDRDGHQDEDGCEDGDDDGDGIPDADDRCRTEPGVPENQGCPVADTDGDGVADAQDRCPKEPGPVERAGCPFRDRDGDTVADEVDNCPDEAGDPAHQGCVDPQLVQITAEKLLIKQKVYFASGESRILAKSFELLDQMAGVLKRQPGIKRVQVEGHTDSRGPRAFNQVLSQARANAVRDYLIKQGVEPERLVAIGLGPDKPADTNATAAGREANRRVEFTILEVGDTTPAAGGQAAPDAAAPAPQKE